MQKRVKLAMIGVGDISGIYLKNIHETFHELELLGVCDRILVMSGGRLAGEVDAKATTQEEIMTLAAKYA